MVFSVVVSGAECHCQQSDGFCLLLLLLLVFGSSTQTGFSSDSCKCDLAMLLSKYRVGLLKYLLSKPCADERSFSILIPNNSYWGRKIFCSCTAVNAIPLICSNRYCAVPFSLFTLGAHAQRGLQ